MLPEREPGDPSRAHVQHRIEVQLSLAGDDLGAVAVPAAVDPVGGELAPDLVRRPATGPSPAAWSSAALAGAGGQAGAGSARDESDRRHAIRRSGT
jgi:hypothetical protein